MKRESFMLLTLALSAGLSACSSPVRTTEGVRHTMFLPAPLTDDWNQWMVGEWEGSGETDTGKGRGTERIELALNGQFRLHTGVGEITEMTPEQRQYLKRNMHASDEEIERFRSSPYRSLEIYTIDQTTGETIGYLFDSLRCLAKGRGKREGNKEIINWEWATGHKSTRITEKASNDRIVVIQRTPMPDGSVMEEKGEMTRKKKQPASDK